MRILDIGAGAHPDLRATHAIDIERQKSSLFKSQIRSNIKQLKPVGLTDFDIAAMRGLAKEVEYQHNVNFNKSKFPYPDDYFEMVVSSNALLPGMTGGSINAYKEAYRVLKYNGIIEISFAGADTKQGIYNHINYIKTALKKVGFRGISVGKSYLKGGYQNIFSNLGEGYTIRARK